MTSILHADEKKIYVCYRSFWPELQTTKEFGEMGINTRCFFAANAINSVGFEYCKYPLIWTGKNKYDWAAFEQQVDDLDKTFAAEYNRELSLGTRDDLLQSWELIRPALAGLLRARWRDLPVFAWGSLRKLHNDVEQTTRRAEQPQKA